MALAGSTAVCLGGLGPPGSTNPDIPYILEFGYLINKSNDGLLSTMTFFYENHTDDHKEYYYR